MKQSLLISVIFLLAACGGKYETEYNQNAASASTAGYAVIQGGPIKTEGFVSSLGGLMSENGYIDIEAVDKQNVTAENSTGYNALRILGPYNPASRTFAPVKLAAGFHEIDIRIVYGSLGSAQKINLNAEAGRRYVIKAIGSGRGGNFWIEDDLGRKTPKKGFRITRR